MKDVDTLHREIADAEAIIEQVLDGHDAESQWARRWMDEYLQLRRRELERRLNAANNGRCVQDPGGRGELP